MVFYAWLGLVVEFVLVLGVVAFVLAGAGYQRSAILLSVSGFSACNWLT